MKYSKNNKFPAKIGIYHYAGIGDWLLLSPVIGEIKRRFRHTKIYVTAPDTLKLFLDADRNIDDYSLLPDYSVFKKNFKLNEEIFLSTFWGFFRLTRCKQHIVNLIYKIFNLGRLDNCDIMPEMRLSQADDDFGNSYAKLLKNEMITLCCDTSEGRKNWDTKRWEKVIRKCKDYIFVQIGSCSNNSVKGAVNLLGRTKLTQAISLVKHSKLFVGCEGFFNHVANIFNTPKVILWSMHNPDNFGYNKNTINIWKRINCSPCHGVYSKKCIRQTNNKKMTQCIQAIDEYEVTNAIRKILGEKHDPLIKYYGIKPVSASTCSSCNHDDKCNINFFMRRFSDLFLFKLL